MIGQCRLLIDRLWDGGRAGAAERAEVTFSLGSTGLTLAVAARFHGDPAPDLPPGRVEGLWNYEVVELFLANEAGHYLEVELGPHGHYLALRFAGVRQLVSQDLTLSYQAEVSGEWWRGKAVAPLSCLPDKVSRANAYAIHGQGDERRYLAAHAVPGPRPDFHQPQFFQPW